MQLAKMYDTLILGLCVNGTCRNRITLRAWRARLLRGFGVLVHARVRVCLCVCVYDVCVRVCMGVCMYVFVRACTCVYVCVYVRARVLPTVLGVDHGQQHFANCDFS